MFLTLDKYLKLSIMHEFQIYARAYTLDPHQKENKVNENLFVCLGHIKGIFLRTN